MQRPFYPDVPRGRKLGVGCLGTTGNLTACLAHAPKTRSMGKRLTVYRPVKTENTANQIEQLTNLMAKLKEGGAQ